MNDEEQRRLDEEARAEYERYRKYPDMTYYQPLPEPTPKKRTRLTIVSIGLIIAFLTAIVFLFADNAKAVEAVDRCVGDGLSGDRFTMLYVEKQGDADAYYDARNKGQAIADLASGLFMDLTDQAFVTQRLRWKCRNEPYPAVKRRSRESQTSAKKGCPSPGGGRQAGPSPSATTADRPSEEALRQLEGFEKQVAAPSLFRTLTVRLSVHISGVEHSVY